jgi:hypothetical protein
MAKAKTNSKRSKSKKSDAWFKSVRGSYLPASAAGWLTYIPFVAYLALSVVLGIRDTSSNGLAVLFIVPNWVAAAAVMTWIASRKS